MLTVGTHGGRSPCQLLVPPIDGELFPSACPVLPPDWLSLPVHTGPVQSRRRRRRRMEKKADEVAKGSKGSTVVNVGLKSDRLERMVVCEHHKILSKGENEVTKERKGVFHESKDRKGRGDIGLG